MNDIYRRTVRGTSSGDTYIEVAPGHSVNTWFIRLITYDSSNDNQATIQQITLYNDAIRQLFEGLV